MRPDYIYALVVFQDSGGRSPRTMPVFGTERNTEGEATMLAGDRRANGDAFPDEVVERFPADVWQMLVENEWKRPRAPWTTPPNPRPHTWGDGVAHCTSCGVLAHGPMAKLTCGLASNLSKQDREQAAEAGVRS